MLLLRLRHNGLEAEIEEFGFEWQPFCSNFTALLKTCQIAIDIIGSFNILIDIMRRFVCVICIAGHLSNLLSFFDFGRFNNFWHFSHLLVILAFCQIKPLWQFVVSDILTVALV